MNILCIIPARGGSKGIPYKNIKPLNGKPLIEYTIDVARHIVSDENICVTTDDDDIISVVKDRKLNVPFKRPNYLATDTCGTYEVLLHALDFYEKQGVKYDAILLLQTTSPFRTVNQIKDAIALYNPSLDMVVGVKEVTANPYFNCFEENEEGFLGISKGDATFVRRQDAPQAWEYNGAVYVINPDSLRKESLGEFKRIIKYEMDDLHSVDIDTPFDWVIAETLLKEKMIEINE